jgi:tellurite resistance protein TerC
MNTSNLVATTVTELALSVDNVMVWAILLSHIGIPKSRERFVLACGVAAAFVIRFAAIAAGSVALQYLHGLTYVLGLFLIWTGYKVTRESGEESGMSRLASRFRSPSVAAVVALSVTDVVFAVDSIPASFGITSDMSTIVAANAIALVALWSLYRVVVRAIDRFPYINYGLAIVLAYIGVGMLAHDYVDVPSWINVMVIALTLTAAATFGIRKTAVATN